MMLLHRVYQPPLHSVLLSSAPPSSLIRRPSLTNRNFLKKEPTSPSAGLACSSLARRSVSSSPPSNLPVNFFTRISRCILSRLSLFSLSVIAVMTRAQNSATTKDMITKEKSAPTSRRASKIGLTGPKSAVVSAINMELQTLQCKCAGAGRKGRVARVVAGLPPDRRTGGRERGGTKDGCVREEIENLVWPSMAFQQ